MIGKFVFLLIPLFALNFNDLSHDAQKEFQIALAGQTPSEKDTFINRLSTFREEQKQQGKVTIYVVVGELIAQLADVTDQLTKEQVQEWYVKAMVANHHSIFFKFPELELDSIQRISALIELDKAIEPTQIDLKYRQFIGWLDTVASNHAVHPAVKQIKALFEREGSYGELESIQRVAREILIENHSKGASKEILQSIACILDITNTYELLQVDQAIKEWQEHLDVNVYGELFAISAHLQDEIETILLYGGGLNEFKQLFDGCDTVYFQYPSLDVKELRTLFNAAALPIAKELTEADFIYRSIHKQLKMVVPEKPDAVFLTDALERLQEMGSYATTDDLKAWYGLTFIHSGKSPYMRYPGIKTQTVVELANALKFDGAQQPTLMDQKYVAAQKWMRELEPGSDEHHLAVKFISKIEELGSYGDINEIQNWTQVVVDHKETEQKALTHSLDKQPIKQASCRIGPNSRIGVAFRGGDGVGYDKSYSTFAAFITPDWNRDFQPFLDLRGHSFVNGRWATNLGLGARWRLWSSRYALGTNFFYDWRNSFKHLSPHQLGFGSELLGPYFDVRINGYLPIGKVKNIKHGEFDRFEGNFLVCRGNATAALSTFQSEIGGYLPWWFKFFDMYAAIGPYYLFERNIVGATVGNAWGVKARLSAQLYDGLKAEFDITYDSFYNTRPQGYLSYTFPLGPSNLRTKGSRWKDRYPSQACHDSGLQQRCMTQSVERNEIIPLITIESRFLARNPSTGEPLFFIFVDNTSNSLGTFESPYPSMALAEANSKPGDIIYVFPGDGTSKNYDTGFLMKSRQVLQSATDTFALFNVNVPPLVSGDNPILTNTAGDALTLANDVQVAGFTFADAANDGVNGSSATNYLFLSNIITNNAVNGFESTGAPAGLKQIFNNQFLADNTSLTLDTAEILLNMPPGNQFEIFNNIIDASNQSAYGIRVANIEENTLLFIKGNNISNYLGPGSFTAGAAVIDANPTGSQPAEIFLTKNTLTGSTAGSYTLNLNSGEITAKINGNNFNDNTFFHSVVFNNATARTTLETNYNNYNNPAISFGQVTIQQFGATGQLCHQITGNNALPATGYLFISSSAPSQYQIESSDGASTGVSAANTGTVFFSPSAASFTFVTPGAPCP